MARELVIIQQPERKCNSCGQRGMRLEIYPALEIKTTNPGPLLKLLFNGGLGVALKIFRVEERSFSICNNCGRKPEEYTSCVGRWAALRYRDMIFKER